MGINDLKPLNYNYLEKLKSKLEQENLNLIQKLEDLDLKIVNSFKEYLEIAKTNGLRSKRQIKPLTKAKSKQSKIQSKLKINNEIIEFIKNSETNIFKLKKKAKETVYYQKEENILLEYIYKSKLNAKQAYLEEHTKKYIELGKTINEIDKHYSLDKTEIAKKQNRILKKLKRSQDERKTEKLKNEYKLLIENNFLPKYKLFKKFYKKILVKKLFKLSKENDQIKARIQKYRVNLLRINENALEKLSFFQVFKKAFNSLNYKKQRAIFGVIFLLPWFIGFCIFFLTPLASTFWWSLNKLTVKQGGGFDFEYTGFENFRLLFTEKTLGGLTISQLLTSSVLDIAINLPVIIIFSLFIAVILNTKFKGHQMVKAIFFIPVIFNMTVISNILSGIFGQMLGTEMGQGFALSGKFSEFLYRVGIGGGLITFLTGAVDRIFTIVNMSGIQILIFIAALQSIPMHLYEAAKVEGATKYEMFWKITIPMVSPMVLTSAIYTVIDSFTSTSIVYYMTIHSDGTKMATNDAGMYSAISIVYFLLNAFIILIIFMIMKKAVFYYDE